MSFQRADRLDQLPPYLFIEIDRGKQAAIAAGRDIIDFGVGDPDRPTPKFIIDRMAEAIYDARHHRYPFDTGVPQFRDAAAAFIERRFGVKLDPRQEVLALIGSKEGLGHVPLAVVNPGRAALVPTPGYPVYRAATIFAGGTAIDMPLLLENGFLPDLDAIDPGALDNAAIMFLNYPNNPTGAVAPIEFYERCVRLARRHDFVICSDAPYTELFFDDGDRPHSIFEVAGAREVAIELHSLSKTFNMTGWRVAFAIGRPDVLAALAKVKGNMDSGVFGAIQIAAITALDGFDRPEVAEIRRVYRERRDALIPGLNRLGFATDMPRATFYVWSRCPGASDSMTCARRLLDEADIVAIPGVGFGAGGDGFVRFALTVELNRIETALRRMSELSW
jgi:LL-diaminopimelate aminotransferase